jgi:L-aspartate oxidase
MTREPIPVVPAAHYICGGILVNSWAESSLKRLFALGECACTGVHGANRLASNSLLEALVFATRAAQRVKSVRHIRVLKKTEMKKTSRTGPNLKLAIKELMNAYIGVIRTDRGLRKARQTIETFSQRFDEGIHIINAESRNITNVAALVVESALMRKESRGLHFIEEYPKKDNNFLKDTVIQRK